MIDVSLLKRVNAVGTVIRYRIGHVSAEYLGLEFIH